MLSRIREGRSRGNALVYYELKLGGGENALSFSGGGDLSREKGGGEAFPVAGNRRLDDLREEAADEADDEQRSRRAERKPQHEPPRRAPRGFLAFEEIGSGCRHVFRMLFRH